MAVQGCGEDLHMVDGALLPWVWHGIGWKSAEGRWDWSLW